MTEIPYLHDIVILFGSILVVIVASYRLKVPAIIGFLVTGVLVGPHGLKLVHDSEHVEVFAEFGVVFLLFVIGIELSFNQLKKLWHFFIIGGFVQTAATVSITTIICIKLGHPLPQSIFYGLLVALSSTAIVLRLYSDKRELNSPQGKVSTAILLFQDLLIVPLLLIVPILGGTVSATSPELITRFGGGLAVVALTFIIGRNVLPVLLKLIIQTGVREIVVIVCLFTCLGAALLTEWFGFSLALGAFLSGILISESDYRSQLLAEITPFRDVFNSMFFISVGMLLHLDFFFEHLFPVLFLVLCIILLKAVILIVTVVLLKFPIRTAIIAAMGLAQVGEFSFVLIRAGSVHGLFNDYHYQMAIASAVFTMILTPLLFRIAPKIAAIFDSLSGTKTTPIDSETSSSATETKVVVCGYGLNGRHLARVLKTSHVPYIIIDLNGYKVEQALKTGEPIIYGDVTRPEILIHGGIKSASVAVLSFPDPPALRHSIRLMRQLNPNLYIIVRSQYLSEWEELRDCGADQVIAQEFETSIEIVTMVLSKLHLPGNLIRTQSRILREDGYEMLRAPSPVIGISEKVFQALYQGTTDSFFLSETHFAVGKSISELRLRKETGASVIAIVQGNNTLTNPPPEHVFNSGDVLVMVGSHAEIDNAFIFLEKSRTRK